MLLPSKQNSSSFIRSIATELGILRFGFLVSGSYDHQKFDNNFDRLRISASLGGSGTKIVNMGPYLFPYQYVRAKAG
jgi:hypothetical protein